jgi:hypothetical protein
MVLFGWRGDGVLQFRGTSLVQLRNNVKEFGLLVVDTGKKNCPSACANQQLVSRARMAEAAQLAWVLLMAANWRTSSLLHPNNAIYCDTL